MIFSPEVISRIDKIKKIADELKDVAPNHPKVHDFLRNGQGAGDIIWLANLLTSQKNDNNKLFEDLCSILNVENSEDIVSVVKRFVQDKEEQPRNVKANGYYNYMAFGDNDDEIDYHDDHDPELDGYDEDGI